MRTFLGVLVIFVAVGAGAQSFTVTVQPPNPSSATPVVLRISRFGCSIALTTVQRSGSSIRIDGTLIGVVCSPGPANTNAALGILPAGTYTYQVFERNTEVAAGSFLVVDPPRGPTLSPASLAAMVAALAVAGFVAMARR